MIFVLDCNQLMIYDRNAMTEVTKDLIQQAHADLRGMGPTDDKMREFAQLVVKFQTLQQQSVQQTAQTIAELEDQQARIESHESDQFQSRYQEHSGDQIVIPMLQDHGLIQEIAYNQELLAERQRGIQTINRDLQELHELFLDLGSMAISQQQGIDNIEAGLEEAARETSRAVQQLEATRLYRRRRRWVGWCSWPVFWCIILAIVLSLIILSI